MSVVRTTEKCRYERNLPLVQIIQVRLMVVQSVKVCYTTNGQDYLRHENDNINVKHLQRINLTNQDLQ